MKNEQYPTILDIGGRLLDIFMKVERMVNWAREHWNNLFLMGIKHGGWFLKQVG